MMPSVAKKVRGNKKSKRKQRQAKPRDSDVEREALERLAGCTSKQPSRSNLGHLLQGGFELQTHRTAQPFYESPYGAPRFAFI